MCGYIPEQVLGAADSRLDQCAIRHVNCRDRSKPARTDKGSTQSGKIAHPHKISEPIQTFKCIFDRECTSRLG